MNQIWGTKKLFKVSAAFVKPKAQPILTTF